MDATLVTIYHTAQKVGEEGQVIRRCAFHVVVEVGARPVGCIHHTEHNFDTLPVGGIHHPVVAAPVHLPRIALEVGPAHLLLDPAQTEVFNLAHCIVRITHHAVGGDAVAEDFLLLRDGGKCSGNRGSGRDSGRLHLRNRRIGFTGTCGLRLLRAAPAARAKPAIPGTEPADEDEDEPDGNSDVESFATQPPIARRETRHCNLLAVKGARLPPNPRLV